jgi:valyl-tRNA synthetase
VEKQLKKEEKKSRHDLGREEFLKRVWAWKEKHGDIIINQLKKLGCSCDWTRERFTMDPEYSRCVQKVFVELYKKELIYRGKRMVNWCPVSQTALSDEEVEMKPQKGFMYYFRVEAVEPDGSPVKGVNGRSLAPSSHEPTAPHAPHAETTSSSAGGEGGLSAPTTSPEQAAPKDGPEIDSEGRVWLTIATTRPETIPGDTAVAVNPKDPRYKHLIGKRIVRPLPAELPREQKLIPIIGDEHVDFEFGTGVLKVTPAHDKADFHIMARYIRQWLEAHPLKMLPDNAKAEERIAFYNLGEERERLMETPEVIDERGIMTSKAGQTLVNLDRFKARKVAAELLKEQGVLLEEKPYENNVGFSQRADVPIEPRLSEQWFLIYPAVEKSKACVLQDHSTGNWPVPSVYTPSAIVKAASSAIPAGGSPAPPAPMRFHPQRWAKVYEHWLTNIQDWCISRQLWWGHRIPVWSGFLDPKNCSIPQVEAERLSSWVAKFYENSRGLKNYPGIEVSLSGKDGEKTFIRFFTEKFSSDINKGYLLTAATISEFEIQKLEQLGFTQDPDVLDTWFSSWLWPFATMGWPEPTETLKKFYPTTDLVTGPDIIFFWVARMIMAGYEFMGDLPFQNVYFTGIIRDKQGRKMSKTLGNSPDPLELITTYGADALRFGTMRSAPLGQDVLFDEKDVELGRNFCNKLWNACRFRQMQGGEVQGEIERTRLTTDDKWILLKLDAAIREVSIALNEYKFSEATAALYRFFWSEYCDWYVEASKAVFFGTDPAQKANTLAVIDFVLSHTLRMFHPFLPFITEELWHGMGYSTDMPENQGGKTIMNAPWPMPLDGDIKGHYGLDDCYLEMTDNKYDLVTQGRNLRRAGNIQAAKKVKYFLKPAQHLTPHDAEVIKLLLNAEALEVNADYRPPKGTPTVQSKLGELFLPLEGLIDVAAEKVRLAKELEMIQAEIVKVEHKLANPNFTQKVPPAVLSEHMQRRAEWKVKLAHTQSQLDAL